MFVACDLQGVHIYFVEHFTNTGKIFSFAAHLPFITLPKLYRVMNHSLVTALLLFLLRNISNFFWCKNFRHLRVMLQWDLMVACLSDGLARQKSREVT